VNFAGENKILTSEYRLGESSIRAVRKIRTDQLELPSRPDYSMPTVSSNITSLSDEDLMELFVELTSWLDYTEVQLAVAQIDEEYERLLLEEIKAHEQVEASRVDVKDVTTKKAMAFENEDFIEQRDKVHNQYGYRKITETVYNRLDRGKFIVSREITRRTGGSAR
jgi:hypothetical protein